jgi:nicotinamidase-related amidase
MHKGKPALKIIVTGVPGLLILIVLSFIACLVISGLDASKVTEGRPIEKYSGSNPALLVIDIQESVTGSLFRDPYYRENSGRLIRNINTLSRSFRDQDVPVIFIRSEITNPVINLLNSSFAKGSPGAQFDIRLKTDPGIVVVKRAQDSFKRTTLDSILISNRINELYIAGLDAADCVNATIKAAQNRGYGVTVVEEALLSTSAERKQTMIDRFRERGISITNIDRLRIID